MEDLQIENYKTLMKKIYKMNKQKNINVHRLEELMLLKYLYYPKQTTDQMHFLSIFHAIFTQNNCMEPKNALNSQSNLEKGDFKTYLKVIAITTVWYWYKQGHID